MLLREFDGLDNDWYAAEPLINVINVSTATVVNSHENALVASIASNQADSVG